MSGSEVSTIKASPEEAKSLDYRNRSIPRSTKVMTDTTKRAMKAFKSGRN